MLQIWFSMEQIDPKKLTVNILLDFWSVKFSLATMYAHRGAAYSLKITHNGSFMCKSHVNIKKFPQPQFCNFISFYE
jgi:hypothetical protein